ncbi:MAG: YibE/F family protein [Candidatus Falkowbacteria bacterium]|nr:MAG: YibE/F family protein [Candidatus Falkowbacteria bacterium]
MKKTFVFIFLFLISALAAPLASAQDKADSFKAEIIKVEQEAQKVREDGSTFTQQNLRFKVLDGDRKGQEAVYYGISEIEVGDANTYQVGDKVFIDAFSDENGQETYYVVDYVRSGPILWLTLIFVLTVIIVGRVKGLRALLSLVVSFFIIIKFILPQILNGRDPFLISLIGGLMMMFFIIYLTEGFNRKSHLAIFSVFLSLILTLLLSIIFSNLTRLTGMAQEESFFLLGNGNAIINFKGLLLAGMLIGAIGVLDDIILGQIEAVDSIRLANPKLPPRKVFALAYKVGNTHLGAIVNTLFLTYAGAALPLLLLLIINQQSGLSISRALNTESVTTEIVRTLVGSIGVMASMPIATFLASWRPNWTKAKN